MSKIAVAAIAGAAAVVVAGTFAYRQGLIGDPLGPREVALVPEVGPGDPADMTIEAAEISEASEVAPAEGAPTAGGDAGTEIAESPPIVEAPDQPSPPLPSFDIVRVEPSGDALIAGRAEPGALVRVILNGEPIGEARADGSGSFVAMMTLPQTDVPGAMILNAEGPSGALASLQTVIIQPTVPEVAPPPNPDDDGMGGDVEVAAASPLESDEEAETSNARDQAAPTESVAAVDVAEAAGAEGARPTPDGPAPTEGTTAQDIAEAEEGAPEAAPGPAGTEAIVAADGPTDVGAVPTFPEGAAPPDAAAVPAASAPPPSDPTFDTAEVDQNAGPLAPELPAGARPPAPATGVAPETEVASTDLSDGTGEEPMEMVADTPTTPQGDQEPVRPGADAPDGVGTEAAEIAVGALDTTADGPDTELSADTPQDVSEFTDAANAADPQSKDAEEDDAPEVVIAVEETPTFPATDDAPEGDVIASATPIEAPAFPEDGADAAGEDLTVAPSTAGGPIEGETAVVADPDGDPVPAEVPSAGDVADGSSGGGDAFEPGPPADVAPATQPEIVVAEAPDAPAATEAAGAEQAAAPSVQAGPIEGERASASPSEGDVAPLEEPLATDVAEGDASDDGFPESEPPAGQAPDPQPGVAIAEAPRDAPTEITMPRPSTAPATPVLGEGPVVIADLPDGGGIGDAPAGASPAQPEVPMLGSAPDAAGGAPVPEVVGTAGALVPPSADEVPVIASPAAPQAPAAPDAPASPPAAVEAPRVILAEPGRVLVLQDSAPPPPIALDSIAYDEDGAVRLSGRGEEGDVRLYVDNEPVKTVRIDADGSWEAGLPEVDPGVYTLRLDRLGADGEVSDRIETPFKKETRSALAAVRAGPDGPAIVTVQPGFTLWAIAAENYGDGAAFVKIFEANASRVRDPDLIYPGQVFAVPD